MRLPDRPGAATVTSLAGHEMERLARAVGIFREAAARAARPSRTAAQRPCPRAAAEPARTPMVVFRTLSLRSCCVGEGIE
jgi:hypothetical protein